MRRAVGLSIAAVVLSITVGVLVGLVIHTGMQQRASRPPQTTAALSPDPTTSTTGAAPSAAIPAWSVAITPVTDPDSDTGSDMGSDTGTGPDSTDPDGTADAAPVAAGAPVSAASGSTSTPGAAEPSGRPSTTAATATVISDGTTSATPAPSTIRPAATRSVTSSTPASRSTPASVSSSAAARPGRDNADGPCGPLGAKSAAPGGNTLFCQHDQQDGSLRWRAVTNGGGCLNMTMTGIGTDGRHYACRRDANGLNYWRPVR